MLWALAIDHRSSFRSGFLGVDRPLTASESRQVRRAKAVALDALLAAVDRGLPCGRPALLIDEEHGAGLISQAKEAGVAVIVPVERSGQDELAFEHGDDGFGPAIERVDPTYVKALVRYNPAGQREVNARQRKRLAHLQAWLDAYQRDWMLELLVPPAPHEREVDFFDRARWDTEVRPALTVEAIGELVGSGLHPAYWKLEGMPTTAAYEAVASATRASGRSDTTCLVLGRGADADAVDRWLRLAAPLPSYQGFAVGRTLWWEPLKAVLAGDWPAPVAADRIADSYRRLVGVYLTAASQPLLGDA